jgi:hypothetical protein
VAILRLEEAMLMGINEESLTGRTNLYLMEN